MTYDMTKSHGEPKFKTGSKVLWEAGKYDSYVVFSSFYDCGWCYELCNNLGGRSGSSVSESELVLMGVEQANQTVHNCKYGVVNGLGATVCSKGIKRAPSGVYVGICENCNMYERG